ncbi:hypothetical protein ACF0H5_005599 [Mactra antiquata]
MGNASNGFRRSGLFPLTADGIDKSKLAPSRVASRTSTNSSTCDQSLEDSNITVVPEPLNISDVAAYEEVWNVTSTPQGNLVDVNLDPDHDFHDSPECSQDQSDAQIPDVGRANDVASPNPAELAQSQWNRQKQRDHDYISPAFLHLSIPEPKKKKVAGRMREKLPKALSGKEALRMLREKKAQKEAAEKAKEERKRDRENKKIKKAQEVEEKHKQRELKKRKRELKKQEKLRSKKSKKRSAPSSSDSDSGDENAIPFMDSDSDDFEEEFEVCPRCFLASGRPNEWIKCESCRVQWHAQCAKLEFLLLDKEGRRDVEFICPDCL